MEWSILTTFFSFISLILVVVIFTLQDAFTKKLNHYIDVAMGHTESLRTILSILQQMEAKQDLMFNNAPPVPGEVTHDPISEELSWENLKHPRTAPADYLRLAQRKLVEHKTKVSSKVPTKKRGRPKKAPSTVTVSLD